MLFIALIYCEVMIAIQITINQASPSTCNIVN